MFDGPTRPQKFIMAQEDWSEIMTRDLYIQINELKAEIKELKESHQVMVDKLMELTGQEIIKQNWYYSHNDILDQNGFLIIKQRVFIAGPFKSHREALEQATDNYSIVVSGLKIWKD